MHVFDVSMSIHSGMVVWPGDRPFRSVLASDITRGEPATVTNLCLTTHTGTHVDAPRHFVAHGSGVDALDWDSLMGAAVVIDTGMVTRISRGVLQRLFPVSPVPRRLIFRTKNSHDGYLDQSVFCPEFVALDASAGEWLVEHKVKTVGMDYLSVDSYESEGFPVHRLLLAHGVTVIEGMRLVDIQPGCYRLVCLPLNIEGADGSPARVLLIQEDATEYAPY